MEICHIAVWHSLQFNCFSNIVFYLISKSSDLKMFTEDRVSRLLKMFTEDRVTRLIKMFTEDRITRLG